MISRPGDLHKDPVIVAHEMFDQCRAEEQSVREVRSDDAAAQIRAEIRRLGRAERLRLRTARMDDTVVAVRLDARVWNETAGVMREKLTPEPSTP